MQWRLEDADFFVTVYDVARRAKSCTVLTSTRVRASEGRRFTYVFYISLSVTAVYEINICKSASSRRPCSVGIQNRAHLRPAGCGVPGYEEISVFQTPTSVKLIALCSDPTMKWWIIVAH